MKERHVASEKKDATACQGKLDDSMFASGPDLTHRHWQAHARQVVMTHCIARVDEQALRSAFTLKCWLSSSQGFRVSAKGQAFVFARVQIQVSWRTLSSYISTALQKTAHSNLHLSFIVALRRACFKRATCSGIGTALHYT